MQRKGWIASALFAAMCIAGISTLLTQEGASGISPPAGHRGGPAALDPAGARSPEFGKVVPMSLRKGAEIQTGTSRSEAGGSGKVLRLR